MYDKYGREVTVETVGLADIYTVVDAGITVTVATGTSLDKVMASINGMAPADYSPPINYTASYIGSIQVDEDLEAPTLTIPPDLTTGELKTFVVGSNDLEIFLEGMRLLLNDDYQEVGSIGTESNEIEFLIDLKIGDSVSFRMK